MKNRAVMLADAGGSPILIRTDISTADIAGLSAAAGVLTTRCGRTSHVEEFTEGLRNVQTKFKLR